MSTVAAVSRPSEIGRWLVGAVHRGVVEIASERDRWILWAPVLVGLGVGLYFGLPYEPPTWVGPVLAVGAAVCATVSRSAVDDRSVWLWPAAAGVFAVAIGFAAAQIKAAAVGTEMLSERRGPTLVSGRVDRVESFPDGQRLTLHRPTISLLPGSRSLEMARIRLRGAQPPIRPGDRIRVRAVLTPPPAPAVPGAYDFQRQAYFDELAAVGYSVGSATVLPSGEHPSIGVGVWFAPTSMARPRR
jgi:competence protein ComEC